MNYKTIIDEIIPVAIRAGNKIMEIYQSDFSVDYKENKSPLTLADQESNNIIVTYLKNKYPKISILSEESKDNQNRLNNDYCFIVDPLDGTKEFIKRNGEFTVNIALSYRKTSVLGVIYVPVSKELYFAYENGGAYYKNNRKSGASRIYVSNRTRDLRLVMSRSHASSTLKNLTESNKGKIDTFKKAGSSLKGCLVAKGEADIYYRFNPTMEWDTAAMQIIVEEAGGIFKKIDGTDMTYNRKNSLNHEGFYIINKIENNLLKK